MGATHTATLDWSGTTLVFGSPELRSLRRHGRLAVISRSSSEVLAAATSSAMQISTDDDASPKPPRKKKSERKPRTKRQPTSDDLALKKRMRMWNTPKTEFRWLVFSGFQHLFFHFQNNNTNNILPAYEN